MLTSVRLRCICPQPLPVPSPPPSRAPFPQVSRSRVKGARIRTRLCAATPTALPTSVAFEALHPPCLVPLAEDASLALHLDARCSVNYASARWLSWHALRLGAAPLPGANATGVDPGQRTQGVELTYAAGGGSGGAGCVRHALRVRTALGSLVAGAASAPLSIAASLQDTVSLEVLFRRRAVVAASANWLLSTDAGAADRLLAIGDAQACAGGGSNCLSVGAGAGGAYVSTVPLADDEWVHAVVVYRAAAGTVTVFRNGGTGAGGVNSTTQAVACSGAAPVSTATFLGSAAEPVDADVALVRVWQRALSAAEVLALYNAVNADCWPGAAFSMPPAPAAPCARCVAQRVFPLRVCVECVRVRCMRTLRAA